MEKVDIFKDIAERTGGDIYLGVVGAVRTGKSTFIKRFMETVVLPNITQRSRSGTSDRRTAAKRGGQNDHDDRTEICAESSGAA